MNTKPQDNVSGASVKLEMTQLTEDKASEGSTSARNTPETCVDRKRGIQKLFANTQGTVWRAHARESDAFRSGITTGSL